MRRSRGEWSDIVAEFERSSETHERFCDRRGLNVGSFRGWLYRLRSGRVAAKVARSATPRLLPVRARPDGVFPEAAFVEVAAGGVLLRVPVGADVVYVSELVTELRARC